MLILIITHQCIISPNKRFPRKKIFNNVVEMIGNSPMVRLNKIPKSEGIQCEIGK
jgi:hypothetical protein